jgi:hypothetical protein
LREKGQEARNKKKKKLEVGEGKSAWPWVCERNTQLRHGISSESMHM